MGIIDDRKFHANLVEDCSSSLPTSCHFVVPSKVVMKGLKKIRKRIGLVSKTSAANLDGSSVQPIRFHMTHGSNISLHKNRTVAKRHESFCKGITFTDRPIRINEKICVKLIEKCDSWSGVIRFGFTIHDPSTLKDCLPKYACPDLTSRKGFWAKAVNETIMDENTIMYFYVNKNGTVYYGYESPFGRRTEEEFFAGVDIGCDPLWAMIDVYGNSTTVELVNVYLNNNLIADQEAGFALDNNYRTRNSKMRLDVDELQSALQKITTGKPSASSTTSPLDTAAFFEQRRSHTNGGFVSATTSPSPNANNFTNQLAIRNEEFDLKLVPLPFHEKCGLNIRLNDTKNIASRIDTEYGRGYVFTPYPIVANEFIVVEILKTNPDYVSGMAFGVTSENPTKINARDLPEDADELLDRSESFIVYKNVANTPNVRDCLVFSMTKNGEIKMKRNGEREVSLFYVERDVSYWWFFDLYGSTTRIRAFISATESPETRHILATDAYSHNRINTNTSITRSNPIYQTSVAMPFSSKNQRLRPIINHPSASTPIEYLNETTSITNNVDCISPKIINDTPSPVLVLKCFANGYEPINIILQNEFTAANRPIKASNSSQILQSNVRDWVTLSGNYAAAAVNPTNRMSNCDVSFEKNNNRQYQLQEWAKSNSRRYSTNGCLNECSVCYESLVNAVLYPCGHMCMCYGCATNIWHRGGGHCPMCRATIVDVIKTYKS